MTKRVSPKPDASGKRWNGKPFASFALVALAALGSVNGAQAGQAETTIYVDANGSDSRSGMSPGEALRTPAMAMALAGRSGLPVTVVLSGQFRLADPIVIERGLRNVTLVSSADRPAVLTSGGAASAIVVKADRARISGLTISGFPQRGIFVTDARGVTIRENRILETRSNGWSQGAIHLTGNVAGAIVERNRVKGADYAGIQVDTNSNSDVSNIVIAGNRVEQTCRVIADCGAIYINDRGRSSRGTLIADNDVRDFGPPSAKGRGIYLDDWASYVTVRGNRIEGRGSYAFQIHGGHDNLVTNNMVFLSRGTKPFLYQQHVRSKSWTEMTGNRISGNEFNGEIIAAVVDLARIPDRGRPQLQDNRACTARGCALLNS
ncbi:right-handed parallel beta-helix repeat-containing protein [Qipengyuania soli]|uniref:Right-handed parallel beta-helix repeat-containing protein n=1 Tax=Qipengyuania soli TaxID=2782568 RepID=A0A7S8IV14_9SPHN|nr:right-handed parallel beta-helix repeat-containing protein [Qipengyuania soli]QPC99694.1 right-handed parallel beta-helix repeat-containing protein [Qipengyuania soli]